MDANRPGGLKQWLNGLRSGESLELTLWQEALEQTRQLHNDVWHGVMFFFTLNGVLLAAVFAIAVSQAGFLLRAALSLLLAALGLFVTAIGLQVFRKHRRYYVEMLLRKTLIEHELGFYDVLLSGEDLSFPWKVDRQFLARLLDNPQTWVNDHQFRPGTNSRWLLWIYWGLIALYAGVLVAIVLLALVGLTVRLLCGCQ
jgi:hypothetical protein